MKLDTGMHIAATTGLDIGFPEASVALGLLLIISASVSGLVNRTVLSNTVFAVLAGALLTGVGLLDVSPGAHSIVVIVEIVLLMTLFSDGLLVEQDILRHHWSPAARALVIAMPVNALFVALGAKLLFGVLTWSEAFLLGFLLSPTDPVVTSSLVASKGVPARVRHTLNLESGLNDGLALPFVLLFVAITEDPEASVVAAGGELGLQTLLGFAAGGLIGLLVSGVIGRLPAKAITGSHEGLVLLGAAALAYGATELVHGNGLIAAFVAGGVVGLLRPEAPDLFHRRNENVVNVLHLVAFVIFGALVLEVGYSGDVLALVAFVVFALVVARPASVLISFFGVDLHRPERLFIAWFGPKGVASMLFALFVLDSTAQDKTLIFEVAAFTILASIVAHGLTDTVGAKRIETLMSEDTPGPVAEPS